MKTALIIIDMQVGNFIWSHPIQKGDRLLKRVRSLIDKARSTQTPIIYIQNNGGKGDPDEYNTAGWKIHPSINPESDDLIIQKENPDAFHKTDLHSKLRSMGIRKLVVAGLQSEYCVDTTCRRAYSLDYEVVLVGDAHSTWDSDNLSASQIIDHHNNVLGGWFATIRKCEEIIF